MAAKPLLHSERRFPQESTAAWHAYTVYRDLGTSRSLLEVTRRLGAERAGSGLRSVSSEDAKTPLVKKQADGHVTEWSRKHRWVERAAAWDAVVDAHLRAKQLDEIGLMAKRHASQSQATLEALIAPVLAFLRGMQNQDRMRELNEAPMQELLKATILASMHIPQAQKAERLARGVKVIDTEPVSKAGSSQGPATWNVIVHQPERTEPPPQLEAPANTEADEWEEA